MKCKVVSMAKHLNIILVCLGAYT